MKPKALILTVVAVTCGLGASYMASQLLANRETEPAETVEFLVARRNLNMGDVIKRPEEAFVLKTFTKDNAPYGGVAKFDDLKGRILKIHRRAGDAIHSEDLYAENDSAQTIARQLPIGYRAVGLRISLEASAHGWATQPMSRVDVINTVRRADDKSSYAHYLLENVLVLAIDGNPTRDDKATPGNVVMFALSPDDCLRLNLARDMGTLSLALRNINDPNKSNGQILTGDQLQGPGRNVAPAGEVGSSEPMLAGAGSTGALNLPTIDTTNVQPAVEVQTAKRPDVFPHRIIFSAGETSRSVRYLLDKSGHPIDPEDRTDGTKISESK